MLRPPSLVVSVHFFSSMTSSGSKSVYVTFPWTCDGQMGTMTAPYHAAGYSTYDWSTDAHKALSYKEQVKAVYGAIDASEGFVFHVHPTDHAYDFSASRLMLAYALEHGKPVLFVDPLDGTRTKDTGGSYLSSNHKVVGNFFCRAHMHHPDINPSGRLHIVKTDEEALSILRAYACPAGHGPVAAAVA
jgi:hypothetical protein